jgi:ribosomal protein S18 acetylase RimI-like enzyme
VPTTVRELRPDEWPEARELRLRALADAPTAFLSALEEEQAFADEVWEDRAAARADRLSLVCEADGELVGGAVGIREGADVYLVAMWVAPSHRRRGLGLELVDRIVDWTRAQGASRVRLEVNERLEPAVGLYERAGFRRTGARRPLPTDPGHDAVELTLELGG